MLTTRERTYMNNFGSPIELRKRVHLLRVAMHKGSVRAVCHILRNAVLTDG